MADAAARLQQLEEQLTRLTETSNATAENQRTMAELLVTIMARLPAAPIVEDDPARVEVDQDVGRGRERSIIKLRSHSPTIPAARMQMCDDGCSPSIISSTPRTCRKMMGEGG
jgi:hypothetical protein